MMLEGAGQAANLHLTSRDHRNLQLTFESKGWTMNSMAGERVVINVSPTKEGSQAVFTAKTNPSGMLQVQTGVKASKYADRIAEHLTEIRFEAG